VAARLAEEWFTICGGCEVTILDIGEPLLDLLKQVRIVHMPVLMDHKLFGQTGEKAEMEIPEADVGLISGGIRTEEHKKLAKEMRAKCKTLIALGSCACSGARVTTMRFPASGLSMRGRPARKLQDAIRSGADHDLRELFAERLGFGRRAGEAAAEMLFAVGR
jgi:coenzyme F420-reducing hydrogenase gamma subunit